MMIGPAPMIRTLWMSVRFGMDRRQSNRPRAGKAIPFWCGKGRGRMRHCWAI